MGKFMFLRGLFACLFALFLTTGALAQGIEKPNASEIRKKAFDQIRIGDTDGAIISIYDYLAIVAPSEQNRVIQIAQDMRFRLAQLLIQQNRLSDAAEVLETYINLPFCSYPRKANRMLVTCYYEDSRFEPCITAVSNAIEYNENPVVKAAAVSSDSSDDSVQQVGDKGEDPEYTPKELSMLHMTLAESFYNLGRWKECIAPYTYFIRNTEDEQRKGYAIMQLVNALIFMEDFPRILEWIPELYRTDARFDIRVNLALLNAAQALYDAGEYDSALPLYRMILPRDEVIAYQEALLRRMRIEANLVPQEGVEISAAERLLFEIEEKPEEAAADAAVELEGVEKPKEVRELEELLVALKKLPPYENNVAYRIGQIYQSVARYYEAVEYFDFVYGRDLTGQLRDRAMADLIQILLEDLAEVDEAKQRGFAYMSQATNGVAPRQIAYAFTGYFQDKQDLNAVTNLLPYLEGLASTNDANIIRYDTELFFMQAVANLMLYDFKASEEGFKRVLDKFPGSHQEPNALYWYGMSMMFQQKYAEALPVFDKYISNYPEGDLVDDAWYQGGVCEFGLEQYTNAMKRFTLVIDQYPQSEVLANAYNMRGDLYGAQGGDALDLAVADYRKGIEAANAMGNVRQATYGTFQMAEIFQSDAQILQDEEKRQAKYDELIEAVESYRERWGAEADIAKALFWIGKIKIQQKKVDEAVESYFEAIVRFGGDLQQDGVDLMISELVRVARVYLNVQAQGDLMNRLQAALDAADNEVLRLRLETVMAKMDGTELELGKRLIRDLKTLDNATPPVLAIICEASFAQKDYSRGEEMLNIFLNKYEESMYIRAAYKLRAYQQFQEGDYEGALLTAQRAQDQFGFSKDVVWAQLMKARIFYEQDKLDEAIKENEFVLQEPRWRGEPVAEATYQLGQIEEKAGRLKNAFNFYQRVYIQYSGYAKGRWAADAYLDSVRVLEALGKEAEVIKTYQAMLLDPRVNTLPQAEEARKALGSGEVAEIETLLASGVKTNVIISLEPKKKPAAPGTEQNAAGTEDN